jgi:hypothetical protein
VAARKSVLIGYLRDTLKRVDPHQLKMQLMEYVPADAQQILACSGIRDENVFPTPSVLEVEPSLVGYYRLLLGSPQKTFYSSETGLGVFKSMEISGSLSHRQREALPDFCGAMSGVLADLVRQLSPSITSADVHELPLITLGAQFQGANNNTIGRQSTTGVFNAIAELMREHIEKRTETRITIKNAARRNVTIALCSDPDVSIREEFGAEQRLKVAIEIKGGTDRSNAHNRAGEAEKSHQKAKGEGYRDYWTIIAKKGIDMNVLAQESPTTNSWFDVTQVLGQKGEDWEEFRSRLAEATGIPIK